MADVVAVLGLSVDSTGALTNLKTFEDATKRTASTAEQSAKKITTATQRVNVATDAEVAAIRRQEAAANKANNERIRAERVMRDYEAAQRRIAQQDAVAATRATATATATDGADAAFKRIRGSATAAVTALTGMNGAVGSLASTMGSLAAGNAITVGVLAAVAAIGVAYETLTAQTRKLKEEQREAIKALDDLAKRQRQGVGGELAEQIKATTAAIAAQEAALRRLKSAPVAGSGEELGGPGIDDALAARNERMAKEIKKLEDGIAAGHRELVRAVNETNREYSHAQTELLAGLIAGNSATVAEQEKAASRLKNLQSQLAASLTAGGDPSERLQLIADIKALNDALNPSTAKADAAAKREVTAALREQHSEWRAVAKAASDATARTTASDKLLLDSGNRLSKELTVWLSQREKENALYKAISERRAAVVKDIGAESDALSDQLNLIGRTVKEQEQLIDNTRVFALLARGASLEQAELMVKNQRAIENADKSTESWADTLQSVVGIVQLIASAFGDAGKEIAKAATGAQSLIGGVSQLQELRKASAASEAAGNGSTLNTLSGVASQLGAYGQIAAGALQVADALDLFGSRSRAQAAKIREDAIAFNRALDEFAITSRTSLEDALRANLAKANSLVAGAGAATGVTVTGVDFKDVAGLDSFIASLKTVGGRIGKDLSPFIAQLEILATKIRENEEALRKRNAAEEAAAVKDVGVRLLRAQGLTAEADALAQAIADEAELTAAREKFGEGALYTALQVVQAAEAIARAAKKIEDERRSIFDLTNATQAFTDPRGAGQAAFDEAAQRRYNDAVTAGASAAELAAIALYNIAAAADRAAQIMEQDTRTTEGLIGRILGTLGDDRATQDFTRTASNRQELADAIRSGMSESNIALLKFTQFAEGSFVQMQRAIEDGTKAIQDRAKNEIAAIDLLIEVTRDSAAKQIAALDAQIKATQDSAKAAAKAFDASIAAIREQAKAQTDAIDAQIATARAGLEAANKQVSALEKSVATNQKVVDALTTFSASLKLGDLSTLSPQDKLAEARSQFEAQAKAAAGGDAGAAANLPNAANALLQASRGFNASGAGFVSDFERVQSVIGAITEQFGATLPIDQATLEAARQQVIGLQASIELLGKQKDAIEQSAQDQIAAIQLLKEKDAENTQKILDGLNAQKDAISADANATIAKLELDRKSVEDWANAEVARLTLVEQQAHNERLKQSGYWETFLAMQRGDTVLSFDPVKGGGAPLTAQSTAPQLQLTATQETNRVLTEKLDALTARIDRLVAVSVAASGAEVGATQEVASEVRTLAQETRNTGQLIVARTSSRR